MVCLRKHTMCVLYIICQFSLFSKFTLYNDDDMNLGSLLFYIPHTHHTHHIFYSHSKLRQTLAKRENTNLNDDDNNDDDGVGALSSEFNSIQ